MFDGQDVLITGGTGSFGKAFIRTVLKKYKPSRLIVYSRDELKQMDMRQEFPQSCMRFFIGDIRDVDRLRIAMNGVDYVVHAAALKHVPVAEYNPFEAVKTNVMGGQNIAIAAIECGVKKVISLSTDKAVSPSNLYGATKLAMERVLIAANAYSAGRGTVFGLVRYGNVVGSRGSVIPLFRRLVAEGETRLPITDVRMTRFWITLDQGVQTVIRAFEECEYGEVFVPKIPSMKMVDLVKAFGDDLEYRVIGIRPGEKLHETLVSEDETRHSRDLGDIIVITPEFTFGGNRYEKYQALPSLKEGVPYRSDTNDQWLEVAALRKVLES